jgi:hypothetical protein
MLPVECQKCRHECLAQYFCDVSFCSHIDNGNTYERRVLDIKYIFRQIFWSRGSSVGIATGYGPGLIPGSARFFSTAARLTLGPIQPPIQWVPVDPSLRGKVAEA